MALALYMDHHIPRAIATGLRRRGINVVTAEEDGTKQLPDQDLLDRASALGRVLVTEDNDLLVEAAHRQRAGRSFAGIIFLRVSDISIGACVSQLEVAAGASEPAEVEGRVSYVPL